MTKRAYVQLFGKQNRGVFVDLDATQGATVGRDLRLPDGTVVSLTQILNPRTSVVQGVSGVISSPTIWDLIVGRPVFLLSLAALPSGTGLVVRSVADGTGAVTRTLQGETGRIEIENGNGVAGDPAFTLGNLPTVKPSVETGEEATIPVGHQMIVMDEFAFDGGTLNIDGELVVL